MSAHAVHSERHAVSQKPAGEIVLSLAALAAGPAAWALQLLAGFGVSSLACFPQDAPYRQTPPPGWGDEPVILLCVNIACLLLAIAGFLIALGHWRTAHAKPDAPPPERSLGRARFLSACGMLASSGFALAILFDTPWILAVPACWSLS